MSNLSDRWAAASTYEDFMGRWSRQLAPRFVSWLRLSAGLHWLDVGCGTGALTDAICDQAAPGSVLGCDPAAPFIEYARSHSSDPRVAFVVARAGELPHREGGYDSIASLFALNFIPDVGSAIHEMHALAADRGTVSACVWDYAEGMGFLRCFWDAATSMDPAARGLDEGARFPLCHPEALTALFRTGGLRDVRCEPIEIPTVFTSFEDYWTPLLGGTGPAPSYVASLDDAHRAMLADRLRRLLPQGPQGTIALAARAWAVRGTAR